MTRAVSATDLHLNVCNIASLVSFEQIVIELIEIIF